MSSPNSPHGSLASAYPAPSSSDSHSHAMGTHNQSPEQRLLGGGVAGTADSSHEGYYSSPTNPGFGANNFRRTNSRAGSSGRSTGIPALSEKLNPRGNSTAGPIPAMSYAGTQGATLVGSGGSKDLASSKDYTDTYAIDANPFSWDTKDGQPEADDYLHDPKDDGRGSFVSGGFPTRAICNIGALVILGVGLLTLFAGYPIISEYTRSKETTKGGFNLGGVNASGQIANFQGMRTGLIDPDTPSDALEIDSPRDGKKLKLVFSDEFEQDGRSFFPNDDPFWEAVDLHYWGTNNYEWYDPAAITTRDGAMQITLNQHVEHNLNFRGGMVQTWNKFCFTGGYLVASIRLPGRADVAGLWPAFWMMGNLGRAGYGATLEGTWPYSYEACDVGTLQNQTDVNGNPVAAQTGGSVGFNKKHGSNALSFLTGQRLSACTCPGDDHPGPKLSDGSYKGRSAPEIDVFEAQVNSAGEMTVSQSGQWAPFNQYYKVTNTSGPAYEFYQGGEFNVYTGELTQQSTSGVTTTPQGAVEKGGDGSFAEYGIEYETGDDGHLMWVAGGKPSWQLFSTAMDADSVSQISKRPFPGEPMYIILNLGVSQNFGTPVWDQLTWPNVMSIDWVRVYQPEDAINVGCDTPDFPSADYINKHMEAYTNPNLTLWGNTKEEGGYEQYWPRNRLNPNGCDAELSKLPGSPTQPKAKAPARNSNVASYWNKG